MFPNRFFANFFQDEYWPAEGQDPSLIKTPGNIVVGPASMLVDGADIGYTSGGISVRYVTGSSDVGADWMNGIVRKAKNTERLYVKTRILEPTLERMRIAYGQPPSNLDSWVPPQLDSVFSPILLTPPFQRQSNLVGPHELSAFSPLLLTPPFTNVPDAETLLLGTFDNCGLIEHEIILTGRAPYCGVRTFTLYRCIVSSVSDYELRRDAESGLDVEFECLRNSAGKFGVVRDS